MQTKNERIKDIGATVPGCNIDDLAYRAILEYAPVRKPRLRSQNAEEITRESIPLEQLDNMQSDDQIVPVEKGFWALIAGAIQKSEAIKVWYASDIVLSDLSDMYNRDNKTYCPSSN